MSKLAKLFTCRTQRTFTLRHFGAVATARKTRRRKEREGGSNFINVSIRFKLLLLLYNYENYKLYKDCGITMCQLSTCKTLT